MDVPAHFKLAFEAAIALHMYQISPKKWVAPGKAESSEKARGRPRGAITRPLQELTKDIFLAELKKFM